MRVLSRPFALGLFALLAPVVVAGEEDDPAARTKEVSAGFPAPSAEKGYSWDLTLAAGGKARGTYRVKAEPVTEEGAAGWTLSETADVGDGAMTMSSEVRVGKDLVTLSGRREENDGDEKRAATWARNEAGYEIHLQAGEESKVITAAVEGGALAGWASAILFARLIPAEKAVYAMKRLDPTDKEGKYVQDAKIEVLGPQKWEQLGKSSEAWVVLISGEDALRAAFDPATRDFLGAKMDKNALEFVPAGTLPPPEKIDFTKPAKSAVAGALRVMLGVVTADRALLTEAVHWESLLRSAQDAGQAGTDVTVERFRDAVIAKFAKQGEREAAERKLRRLAAGLETEVLENGNTAVRFPEEVGSFTIEMREIDGTWRAITLP